MTWDSKIGFILRVNQRIELTFLRADSDVIIYSQTTNFTLQL